MSAFNIQHGGQGGNKYLYKSTQPRTTAQTGQQSKLSHHLIYSTNANSHRKNPSTSINFGEFSSPVKRKLGVIPADLTQNYTEGSR